MDINNIIWAAVWFAVLGLGLGLLLAFASKVFAVKVDERVDEITELLPGANCGGCGYSGCSALAQAIVDGKADPGQCNGCSEENACKIAAIMGVDASKKRIWYLISFFFKSSNVEDKSLKNSRPLISATKASFSIPLLFFTNSKNSKNNAGGRLSTQ